MWNIDMGKRFAKELWSKTQRAAGTDAAVASALLAHVAKGEARRLLADCVAKERPGNARGTVARTEALDDVTADIASAPEAGAAPRERAAPRMNAKQGAVRLVTLIESRARARGLVVDRSPARADHAISVSVRGAIVCTVSALDGALYVDAVGPAPVEKAPLAWDDIAEVFLPTDAFEWPDPVALIEAHIAQHVRAARAQRATLAA
jgi:hypothetical protein